VTSLRKFRSCQLLARGLDSIEYLKIRNVRYEKDDRRASTDLQHLKRDFSSRRLCGTEDRW
jgi:hypothetical protein